MLEPPLQKLLLVLTVCRTLNSNGTALLLVPWLSRSTPPGGVQSTDGTSELHPRTLVAPRVLNCPLASVVKLASNSCPADNPPAAGNKLVHWLSFNLLRPKKRTRLALAQVSV